MEIKEISAAEYREFWKNDQRGMFLNAAEVAELNEKGPNYFLGDYKKGKLVAAAMVRGAKRRLFGYNFYAPRGVLVDYNDAEATDFFLTEVKKFLKKRGGKKLTIEPKVVVQERDIDGKIVSGGAENLKVRENLEKLGFHEEEYVEGRSQITWQFVLDTVGRTEAEILTGMKGNTRRRIKQVEELGVEFRELDEENLTEFYEILEDTAERKNFQARNLAYFQKMYKLFHKRKEILFISAVINPKKCIQKLMDRQTEILKADPQTIREKKDHEDAVKSIEMRIEKVKGIFGEEAEKDETVTLCSGMFFLTNGEFLHFAGGNARKYLKLDAQYALQWEMIRRAIRGGYKRYNFYGIPKDVDKVGGGVYEFKRGFGGKVEEMYGAFTAKL